MRKYEKIVELQKLAKRKKRKKPDKNVSEKKTHFKVENRKELQMMEKAGWIRVMVEGEPSVLQTANL